MRTIGDSTEHNLKTLRRVFGDSLEGLFDWQRAYIDSGMCPQVEDYEVVQVTLPQHLYHAAIQWLPR